MSNINKEQINNKLFELYTLAELSYISHFKNIDGELFPSLWYEDKNYKLKIEIITEAIKTHTLIVNTQAYQKKLEGIEIKTKKLLNE